MQGRSECAGGSAIDQECVYRRKSRASVCDPFYVPGRCTRQGRGRCICRDSTQHEHDCHSITLRVFASSDFISHLHSCMCPADHARRSTAPRASSAVRCASVVPVRPCKVGTDLPLPTAHSRTVPSPPPLATSWLSALSATPQTPPVWPCNVATGRPLPTSHSRTVPSPPPLATSWLSA